MFFSSVAQLCLTLYPMDCSTPGLPVHQQLPEVTQTHVHWVGDASNHLILCRPLLLLPSISPNIRVFSSESVLYIRWPKYWSSASLTSLIHQSTNIYAAILRTRILCTSLFTKWVFFACMLSCVWSSVTLWTVATVNGLWSHACVWEMLSWITLIRFCIWW